MSDYKKIPGFGDKYEINALGEVRNARTLKVTKSYYSSKKLGPIISLANKTTEDVGRISVLVTVKQLFGTDVPGWEGHISEDIKDAKIVKVRLTPEVKAERAAAKEALKEEKAKAKAQKAQAKAESLALAKKKANEIRAAKALEKANAAKAKADAVIQSLKDVGLVEQDAEVIQKAV